MFGSQHLMEKWGPVLDAEGTSEIKDAHKKAITAVVLENTEKALAEERQQSGYLSEAAAGSNTGSVANWDPVLISLVRRAMPNIVAYDIAGVQPMTGPTGLIFAMKATHHTAPAGGAVGDEALFNKPDTSFSGAHATSAGEVLGQTGSEFNEMAFTIEKTTVTAKTRALKAEYTMELAQDLKAIHGLDAESELAHILSTEILAEINREVLDQVNSDAVVVADWDLAAVAASGNDGRWAVERYKNLLVKLEFECNAIAIATRRGRGNFIICSSNVASALSMTGALEYAPSLATGLNVDDTGNIFAGVINGRIKVYIDPFATADYITVGYKGSNAYDAGIFYCPYVPLTMVKAIGQDDFQPKIGFKTRYGMVANPFCNALGGDNVYYRRFVILNL